MLPEKEHLFKKYLSKHSIGAYRELYRGVSILFKAILAPKLSNATEGELLEERRGTIVGVFLLPSLN